MKNKEKLLRQKRYGQYFSGEKVADLLTELLPEKSIITNAIDPMAGVGDMLLSVQKKLPEIKRIVGIEIDGMIIDRCQKRNPNAEIIQGDAFSANVHNTLEGWDLVITNPPYIRYQLTNGLNDKSGLPSAEQVRSNLYNTLLENKNLNKQDRELFLRLTKQYSGLSDMAVPSWILCASLVKEDGLLAMVVPETWLSREYALPIQYMLLSCFHILSITSDVGAAWFENAQVKTCLVVAKRKKTMVIEEVLNEETYCMHLDKALIGSDTLVDFLRYGNLEGLKAIKQIQSEKPIINNRVCRTTLIKTYLLFPHIFSDKNIQYASTIKINKKSLLPVDIRSVIECNEKVSYGTLEESGWKVGQGLRTGANDFFYCDVVELRSNETVVKASWYEKNFTISNSNLITSLHTRNEIEGLCVTPLDLKKRLIYIKHQVRDFEKELLVPELRQKFSVLNFDTANYLTEAEYYEPITGRNRKKFKDRSAVQPNERKFKDYFKSFWYMLPTIKARHIPCLCLPRVCGKSIECLFVEQSIECPITVDANFITLWNECIEEQMIVFALLNSTWMKCYMESISTVMGGGALKIEATHVRKVLFPKYTEEQKIDLCKCGKELKKANKLNDELLKKIDLCVLAPFGEARFEILRKLRNKLQRFLVDRGARYSEF